MAASDVITVIPGLFLLHLPINKDMNIDKAVVETRLRDLDRFLRVKIGRSEELAILNLQGLLTLRLRRYEEAVEYFQAVLNNEPENLNALANLHYVLEKLFRSAEAEEYNKEKNRLIHDESMGAQKRNAKCLAEQAFAYAFDIHSDDTISGTRFKESNKLYTKALEIGGSAVGSMEKDDWNFCKAINAQKLFDTVFYAGEATDAVLYINMTVKLFFEIIHSDQGDPYLQWDSWCHLGDLFRKIQIRKIEIKVSTELQEFKDDPEKCMLKAMEISPDNARLLARYANFLYSLNNKDIDKPLELLQQSISLDSSEFNYYAFTTRAMINIKWYVGQHNFLNRGMLRISLELAKTDLEKAMSMRVTPWDLARLGKVYHLLAKHHTEQDMEIGSLIEKALLYFTKSAECQDGLKRTEVHIMRGRCLFDIGEYRSAVGSYKQAIECESKTSTYTGNYDELLNVYLSMLHEKETEDDSILKEIAFSLKMALVKYTSYKMSRYCIAKYRHEYNNELQQLGRYCKQFEELGEVVSVLQTSVGEFSQGRPIPKGGTLKQSWNQSRRRHPYIHPGEDTIAHPLGLLSSTAKKHLPHLAKVGLAVGGKEDEGTPENRAKDVDHSSDHRYTPDGCSDISKDVTHLPRGIHSITVKDETTEMADQRSTNEKEFDFNVVHSLSQLEWVNNLVKELEDRKLKGCTFDRDVIAGSWVLPSYISLMKQSTVILLVLSEDFKDECKHLLLHALNKVYGSKPIPIRTDDSEVPEEISGIIRCFDATTDPVDWDKLASDIKQHKAASSR